MEQGGEGRGQQMSIHLLYTGLKKVGWGGGGGGVHISKSPFFHFYWHSPTVYKTSYTRVDQFTS